MTEHSWQYLYNLWQKISELKLDITVKVIRTYEYKIMRTISSADDICYINAAFITRKYVIIHLNDGRYCISYRRWEEEITRIGKWLPPGVSVDSLHVAFWLIFRAHLWFTLKSREKKLQFKK